MLNKNGQVLVVSALYGGAAEIVLRAITHDTMDGVSKIPDTNCMMRSFSAPVADDSGRVLTEGCLVGLKPFSDRQSIADSLSVRFILGTEVGVVLRDVERLSKGRKFSTKHIIGAEGNGIDYVFPIARGILGPNFPNSTREIFEPTHMNLRRAVYDICAFIFKHKYEGLLTERGIIRQAEKDRLQRRFRHITSHRTKRDPTERFVSMW